MSFPLPKRHKYNARRTEFRGLSFPSQLECDVYALHKMLETQGLVSDIVRYPQVRLKRVCACGSVIDTGINYTPDFKLFDKKISQDVWIEAKGVEQIDWRKNYKLWKAGFGPGILRIYKANKRGVYLHEEVKP